MDFFQTSPAFYDPAAYAAFRHQASARGNSAASPPASPRGSSSFSTHALREALPSLPHRAASPEPHWPSEPLSASGHGGPIAWQDDHGGTDAWHGAVTGGFHGAPAGTAWDVPAWSGIAGLHAVAGSQPFPSPAVLQQRAQEWQALCSTTLRHDGDDERLTQAMRDLFMVFVDSPTFRRTMATVRNDGPVDIRIDPEVATAYFDGGRRAVVVGEVNARSRVHAMAMVAFELTNASLASAFSAHVHQAAVTGMHPRAYAEGVERIEYNSVSNCQAYYREARQSLQRAGLDNPGPWYSRITADGDIQPVIASEEESLRNAQATGHFGRYEQDYAGMH